MCPFVAVWASAVELGYRQPGTVRIGTVLAFDGPNEFGLYFVVSEKDRFADYQKLFGGELSVDPPTVVAQTGGFGGGPDVLNVIENIWDIAANVGTAVGIAQGIRWGLRKNQERQYASARRLIHDWTVTGVVSPELSRMVEAGGSWELSRCRREFGTDDFRSSELLLLCGFQFAPYVPGGTDGGWARRPTLDGTVKPA